MTPPSPCDRHPPRGAAGMVVVLAVGLVVGCGQETEPSQETDPAQPQTSESQISESQISAAGIPRNALRYKRTLIREAQARFGLNAPIARLAGQIHQESGWRSDAKSPYAEGLAQFTADTAEWIAKLYPKDLGKAAPYSPNWAIRALVIYDERILNGVKPYAAGKKVSECDRWAMALSGYNGGPGWIKRDRNLAQSNGADPDRWWDHVEKYTSRSERAREENRSYPKKILYQHEPLYRNNGWTGQPTC